MTEKEIIGGLAVMVGMVGQSLYMWQIFHRKVKPHIFSWIIWGMLGVIGCAAQYAAKAGPGCWGLGVTSILCFVVAATGLFYGEKSITRGDWISFIVLLSAIPAWIVTNNPLWAVVIVSAIDAGAFYPTFRKSWMNPHHESASAFFIWGLQMLFSLAALESFTVTTALYPATIIVTNTALPLTLLYRRRVLA